MELWYAVQHVRIQLEVCTYARRRRRRRAKAKPRPEPKSGTMGRLFKGPIKIPDLQIFERFRLLLHMSLQGTPTGRHNKMVLVGETRRDPAKVVLYDPVKSPMTQ